MSKNKKQKDFEDNRVLSIKLGIYGVIVLIALGFLAFAPKGVIKQEMPYYIASSLALLEDDSLVFYDYEVYSNVDRFEAGLVSDVSEKVMDFKARDELLAVKVTGPSKIEFKNDYYLIYDPDVPELNIEFYLIKTISVANTTFPARTVILLLKDVSLLANTIYIAVLLIVSLGFAFPFLIKFLRVCFILSDRRKVLKTYIDPVCKDTPDK